MPVSMKMPMKKASIKKMDKNTKTTIKTAMDKKSSMKAKLSPMKVAVKKKNSSMKIAMKNIAPRNTALKMKQAADPNKDAVLACTRLSDWLKEESKAFKGMLVRRPKAASYDHRQAFIERAQTDRALGSREERAVKCNVTSDASSMEDRLDACAQKLLAPLYNRGLPKDLESQIRKDASEIGLAVTQLLPEARQLILKLEIVCENSCQRWH
eukprot:TRINITY_DN100442_c0_g1_i1.p1 TRINITY_DN100442_c0_g1~~TRINITY_DN100442_c0_g1_i1.p1  ORF type:complete len:246 (+),score=49.58 TRINITY_DN100442_c0_g1_i1:107-739(+)